MNRQIHVRFWEGLGVRFPWATRLFPSTMRARACSAVQSRTRTPFLVLTLPVKSLHLALCGESRADTFFHHLHESALSLAVCGAQLPLELGGALTAKRKESLST